MPSSPRGCLRGSARALMLSGLPPLAGLQTVLPSYLRERFVAAALSYIACGSAGELLCRQSDCRCQCQPAFPRCNCPEADIQALESSLAQLGRAWESHHSQFEESGEAGETPPNISLSLQAAQAGCWVSRVVFSLWRFQSSGGGRLLSAPLSPPALWGLLTPSPSPHRGVSGTGEKAAHRPFPEQDSHLPLLGHGSGCPASLPTAGHQPEAALQENLPTHPAALQPQQTLPPPASLQAAKGEVECHGIPCWGHCPMPQGWLRARATSCGCNWTSSHLAGMPGGEQAAGVAVPAWNVALRDLVQT